MSKYVEPIPVRAMVDIFRKLMVRFVDLENGIPKLYCAFDIARCLDYTSPIDAINKQCIDANVLCIIPNDKVPNRSCTKKVYSVKTNKQRALSVVSKTPEHPDDKNFSTIKIVDIFDDSATLKFENKIDFIDALERIMNTCEVHCIRAFYILDYAIDLYIPDLKLAIEYDNAGSSDYDKKADNIRKKDIENALGCVLCQLKKDESADANLGIVITAAVKQIRAMAKPDAKGFIILEETGKLAKTAAKWYNKKGLPVPDYLV